MDQKKVFPEYSSPILIGVVMLVAFIVIQKYWPTPTNAQPVATCHGEPSRKPGTPVETESISDAGRNVRLWTTELQRQRLSRAGGLRLAMSARNRFQYVLDAMDLTPNEAMNSILDPATRQLVAQTAPGCAESESTLEGRLEIIHFDFSDGRSDTRIGLRTSDQSLYTLHPAGPLRESLLSNTLVRVHGIRLDHDVLFDGRNGANEYSGIDIIEIPSNPPVVGDQRVAVLLVNFQDTTQPSITTQQTKDFVFGPVNDFYKEISNDRIRLIGAVDPLGDVYGWYQVAMNTTCSDIGGALTAAMDAANADVDFTRYTRLIIAAPFSAGNSSCGWGGTATIDRINWQTPDGPSLMSVMWSGTLNLINIYNLGHELGHNFGNNHARFINCGDVSWADSGCTELEYGDRYDVMGSGHAGHFNAPHKEQVGWLTGDELTSVSSSGTYTITPMAGLAAGVKALKIPRGPGLSVYVEYRQPIGADTGLDVSPVSNIFTGALLHSAANDRIDYPYLLDAIPPADRYNPVLPLGATWTDPQTGTTITVTGLTASSLTVDVNLFSSRDITSPRVTLTAPRTNATIGGQVTLSADATDDVGVTRVDFFMDGFTLPMTSDTTAPFTGTIESTWYTGSQHFFRAEAWDAAQNLAVSEVVYVNFSNPPVTPPGGVDTTAPAAVTDFEAP